MHIYIIYINTVLSKTIFCPFKKLNSAQEKNSNCSNRINESCAFMNHIGFFCSKPLATWKLLRHFIFWWYLQVSLHQHSFFLSILYIYVEIISFLKPIFFLFCFSLIFQSLQKKLIIFAFRWLPISKSSLIHVYVSENNIMAIDNIISRCM